MTTEFEFGQKTGAAELGEYVKSVEACPEWRLILTARESIQRLIGIRGRLIGENPSDRDDLLFDLNSFRNLNWTDVELTTVLKTMITIESAYYPYVERRASSCAIEQGQEDRTPEYIDVAKEILAREIWFRWNPEETFSGNGLHYKILGGLKYLSQNTQRAFLDSSPISYLSEEVVDRATRPDYSDPSTEKPGIRLERILSGISLREIFERLYYLSSRERLSMLCLMGYVDGVKNFTQAIDKFGVSHEMFGVTVTSALSKFCDATPIELTKTAKQIVDETVGAGIVKNYNGVATTPNSPRLQILNHDAPVFSNHIKDSERKKYIEIFTLAKKMDGKKFTLSLLEIGKKVGISNPATIYKRIRYMAKQLEPKAVSP